MLSAGPNATLCDEAVGSSTTFIMQTSDLAYKERHGLPSLDLVVPAFRALQQLGGTGTLQQILGLIADATRDADNKKCLLDIDPYYWLMFAVTYMDCAGMLEVDRSPGYKGIRQWVCVIRGEWDGEVEIDPLEVYRIGEREAKRRLQDDSSSAP